MSHPRTLPIGFDGPHSAEIRQLTIVAVAGEDRGKQWQSGDASAMTIGSHPSCDVVLTDPTVSRFHCELRIGNQRATVRDSGSRNGTEVDGVPIVEAHLRDDSSIKLGNTTVQVKYGVHNTRLSVSNRMTFGTLVGQSVAMRATFQLLERAAGSAVTILLEGETGTGKSVSARAVHDASDRASGPFVLVDCGAIPPNLLESELFGHEKGAFTGATDTRIGAFEEAHGGTIVLDEIGELSVELQPKLLGVLETRQVRRVGSNAVRNLDVRVIAATNVDLRAEVNAGRFRPDLYYRLAVLKVQQPSLRDRTEDIPMLARSILASLGASAPQVDALMVPAFVERLTVAPWPGNIRELRNYLERCLVFEEAVPMSGVMVLPSQLPGAEPAVATNLPLSEARERAARAFERAYVARILAAHGGKVATAAAAAGVDRTYFYRLLRRHQLRAGE